MNDLKRALLAELSAVIRDMGSSHDVVANRLGIARPDVSAIHAGDVDRFAFERIGRMLRTVGKDINVNVVGEGDGGQVSLAISLAALGLEDLSAVAADASPGLVLIAGEPNNGQQSVLRALTAEHISKGQTAITYVSLSRRGAPLTLAQIDSSKHRLIRFEPDTDLEQRTRFGYDIVGIDSMGRTGADPWTVLHFAKDARTYAIVESPAGVNEGQWALDRLIAMLGVPRARANHELVSAVLRGIIVVHASLTEDGSRVEYYASTHTQNAQDLSITPCSDRNTRRTLERAAARRNVPPNGGALVTDDDARVLLRAVHEKLGTQYELVLPPQESKREIELSVRHRMRDASVTIAASWNADAGRYGVVICTEQPDDLMRIGITPETRLRSAPADVDYIVTLVHHFMAAVDHIPAAL